MSLIDDALKRAQAADEAGAGRPRDRPWIPTPMPDASLARRRRLIRRLAIGLGAAAVVAAAAIAVRWAVSPQASAPAAPPQAAPRPVDIEWTPVAVATPVTPAARAAAAAPDVVATPVPSVRLHAIRPSKPPTESETSAGAPPPAPAPPPARPSGPIAEGRTYAGSVTLPGGSKIELGGIVWSETEPRALLNDRIVATGGYVEGFRVAEIQEDRVALERDGVTIYLSVK